MKRTTLVLTLLTFVTLAPLGASLLASYSIGGGGSAEPEPTDPLPAPAPDPIPAPGHIDPWPGPVSEPPGYITPDPWPGYVQHYICCRVPGHPYLFQHFEASLPPDPATGNAQKVQVNKDQDGKVAIQFSELVYDPTHGTWHWELTNIIICACPECTDSLCVDAEAVSVWYSFSDWDNDGQYDPGDVYQVVVSVWTSDHARINFYYCEGGDGMWVGC